MKPKCIVADVHLHNWQAFSHIDPETGQNSRLGVLHKQLLFSAAVLKKRGGENLYIAGDLFHVRGKIAPSVLNPTIEVFKRIIKLGVNVRIIPGNHDLEGKNTNKLGSAVLSLDTIGCEICSKTTVFEDDKTIVIPWFDSLDELRAEIKNAAILVSNPERYDLVIHAPVNGVITGLPDHGLSAEELAAFGFYRVFSGHYHNHKDLGDGVYSIGAIAHHTWSDVNTKAGFLIIDGESVTLHEGTSPKFIDALDLEGSDDDIKEIVRGNYVRVKAKMTGSEVAQVREKLGEMGALGVIVQPLKEASVKRDDTVTASISAGASLEKSVSDFVASRFKEKTEAISLEALRILSLASVEE